VREAIEYWSVVTVRGIARRLPDAIVTAWGSALGLTFYALDRPHRRVALTNLEQCFPNKPEAERRAIARAMFAHFGQVLLKLLTFSALTPEQMLERADYEGDERVRLAYAKGKGLLFFTGHFGFWECHAIAHAVKLRPIGVLARTLDNVRLNDLLERIRTGTGNHVIYRQGAVRRVLKTLAAGEGVALLIDQHMHSPDAIWVNFFRRPAATTSTLAALALRTGAAVIPVFAEPLPGGRYKFVYEAPVEPPRADSPDAIREFTQRCTDVLEMHVRRKPELWLWMHRRWRDAPTPDAPGMFPKARNEDRDQGTGNRDQGA
jgi:KDO2-lipid IV(A) lauroyltransferase